MRISPAVQHANEPINRRSLMLRLCRTVWLIPAAAVAGALLGALLYGMVWLSVSGQRQYQQTSKYYLTFGVEENGNAADYYNDYTWNDLIFSDTAIADVIGDGLPEELTMEDAREAIEAQILSDVRLLTIEVTHSDPEVVQQLTNLMEDALVRYGKNKIQFENIEFLSSGEVEAVIVSDRTRNAVLLGAVLGLLVSSVWLWLRELLDDGIYVPEDAVRRYGLPVLAVISAEGTGLPAFLQNETEETLQNLKGAGRVRLTGEDSRSTEEAAKLLREQYHVDAARYAKEDGREKPEVLLLVIPFGRANGARLEHLIERYRARGVEPDGCLLWRADGRFLGRYYGSGSTGNNHE